MLNLSKSELRLTARKRRVKSYNNMSKDELIDAINLLKPAKDNKKKIFLNQKEKKSKRRTSLNKNEKKSKRVS